MLFSTAMILFPHISLQAAQSGINIWFYSVLPALFPFFVFTKLMTYLGFHKIFGRLLEPLIRPLFNVPGEASFVFAMSLSSGYPVGVQMIADLRKSQSISKTDAERMLSFCSTSGPLFMLGTVGTSMFNSSPLGFSIAISHYLGSILNGFLFRFYKKNSPSNRIAHQNDIKTIVLDCQKNFNHGREFMSKISEAIYDSFKALLLVGGFITLFSILIALLETLNFFHFISLFISNPLTNSIFLSYVKGFFEITIGCNEVSQITHSGFVLSTLLCSSIISWSGLSIHAQALTILSKTDLKKSIYLVSKITHTLCTIVCSLIISNLFLKYMPYDIATFNMDFITKNSTFIYNLLFSTKLMLCIFILFIVTVIIDMLKK
ncbi:MAG: nucleoside recognition domain-containing protein [Peptostreptococcales bacterium]